MSYLDRLKAARAKNGPTSATLKTPESIDVTPSERFEGCQSGHISGPAAASPVSTYVETLPVQKIFDMPPEWSEAFDAISLSPAPGDYEPSRWQDTLNGMTAFCDEWAARARVLGWQPSEIFSLDPIAPAARVDRRGLALLLGNGARVESIDDRGADIRTHGGARQRFYRRREQ
jgi:hypothetical protein